MLIFAGNSNRRLADRIAKYLGVELGRAAVGRFPDGEVTVKLEGDVRGADIFLIQSTCRPVNDHLMELLIMVDAMKRASAARITVVVPYFGYARQDRKDEGRVPITAKLVANMISSAGVDRVLTIDLHAAQIQGFFDLPVDHLYGSRVLARHLQRMNLEEVVVTSPDLGGLKMAWGYAKQLDARLAVIEKRRIDAEHVEVGFVIGEVKDRTIVLVDDMISTAGTVCKAAHLLHEKGAGRIIIAATHAVFCGRAIEKLKAAPVDEVIVTDTIPSTTDLPNLTVLSVADYLGEAIHRIHMNKSISHLFRKRRASTRLRGVGE